MLSKLSSSGPFLKQMLATGVIGMIGDGICQNLVEKQRTYDLMRTLKFGLVVGTVVGPFQYVWFRFLARNISPNNERSIITGIKRMFVDQTIAAPVVTSVFLFSATFSKKPHDFNASIENTKRLFPTMIINNYKIWPAIQIINMSLVPLHFRVIFVQFVAILWNMYASYAVNKKTPP